jgi:acyl-coenzyme A synthetase/AMP-(fatty) acid ligase
VLKPSVCQCKDRSAILSLLNELIDYVRENKVRHKWISEIEMLEEIPKSASGKILRRMLRKLEQENSAKERYIAIRDKTRSKL